MQEQYFYEAASNALLSPNFYGAREKVKEKYAWTTYATLSTTPSMIKSIESYLSWQQKPESKFYEKLVWKIILQRFGSVPDKVKWWDCAEIFKWLFDEQTLAQASGLVLNIPYKEDCFLHANFHQLVTTYYVVNALGWVRPENWTLHNPYIKDLRRIKWDITVDVYEIGMQLKKMFGAQLRDFSMKFDTERGSQKPVLAVWFAWRQNIMRPATDAVVVREGLARVDGWTYLLESVDLQQLKTELLLYK